MLCMLEITDNGALVSLHLSTWHMLAALLDTGTRAAPHWDCLLALLAHVANADRSGAL